MVDKRVCFDFEVGFSNGGGVQGQDFRLDIEADDIDDNALAAYIIRYMRLQMGAAGCTESVITEIRLFLIRNGLNICRLFQIIPATETRFAENTDRVLETRSQA